MPKDPWTDPDPQPGDFDAALAAIDPRCVEVREGNPDESLDAAAVLRMRARDPVMARLDVAPYDNEELTTEDREAMSEALAEPGIPWSEVEPEVRAD